MLLQLTKSKRTNHSFGFIRRSHNVNAVGMWVGNTRWFIEHKIDKTINKNLYVHLKTWRINILTIRKPK